MQEIKQKTNGENKHSVLHQPLCSSWTRLYLFTANSVTESLLSSVSAGSSGTMPVPFKALRCLQRFGNFRDLLSVSVPSLTSCLLCSPTLNFQADSPCYLTSSNLIFFTWQDSQNAPRIFLGPVCFHLLKKSYYITFFYIESITLLTSILSQSLLPTHFQLFSAHTENVYHCVKPSLKNLDTRCAHLPQRYLCDFCIGKNIFSLSRSSGLSKFCTYISIHSIVFSWMLKRSK